MGVRALATVLMICVAVPWGAAQELELVWTCPLHREVTEDRAGRCQLCDRELVPTLVQQAWSCPIHSVISEREPGACPICGRDLYLITEEISYACPMHPEVREPEPGSCPVCRMALERSTSTRPHQDHNPKHGGMFFMAPDSWHHLEGTYPEDGIFRVYLYDNFSEPMSAGSFPGRAVVEEVFDPETRETREIVAFPLKPSSDGEYLEAHVGRGELPREITAKLRFDEDGPFERFDFIFAEFSAETDVETPLSPGVDAGLAIPETADAIVSAIAERNVEVRELVSKGAFTEIYLPALEAKDLAVALEGSLPSAPAGHRASLEWALRQLVRSAWLLDDYGDLGNKEKVQFAYELFDEAVAEIRSVYE